MREGRAESRAKEWVSLARERRAAQAARWHGKGETAGRTLTTTAISPAAAPLPVLRVTPSTPAEPDAEIAITFDRPVAGGLDAAVPADAIFSIEPPVPGRVGWRDPVTLRFVPAQPLEPGRAYTVRVAPSFTAMDGSRLEREYVHSFRVAPPRASRWSRGAAAGRSRCARPGPAQSKEDDPSALSAKPATAAAGRGRRSGTSAASSRSCRPSRCRSAAPAGCSCPASWTRPAPPTSSPGRYARTARRGSWTCAACTRPTPPPGLSASSSPRPCTAARSRATCASRRTSPSSSRTPRASRPSGCSRARSSRAAGGGRSCWPGDADGALPNIHEELRLLVEGAGLSPMDTLVAATRNAAEAAGLDASHGTIAPGKAADLLFLSADPTADIRNTRAIAMVPRRGRVVER